MRAAVREHGVDLDAAMHVPKRTWHLGVWERVFRVTSVGTCERMRCALCVRRVWHRDGRVLVRQNPIPVK